MCKVSVVVPCYNHARFLDERIASILAQTYRDYEILFLDDASTDDSLAVFEKYRGHPAVRVLLNDGNSGSPFKQWNKGVRAARGEYVWIAESDDAAEPTFLETLAALLDRLPNVGLAYSNSVYVDERGNKGATLDAFVRHLHPTRWQGDYVNHGTDECLNYLIFQNSIPNASAVVFRKALYEQAGYANEEMKRCGDWWMWVHLLLASDVAYVAAPLNRFRKEHANCTRVPKTLHLAFEEPLQIAARILSRLGFPPGGEEEVRRNILGAFRGIAAMAGENGLPVTSRMLRLARDVSPPLFFALAAIARDRAAGASFLTPGEANPRSEPGRTPAPPVREAPPLPAAYLSCRQVEEYSDLLEQAGCAPAGSTAVRPMDALALGLLLTMAPTRPTLLDLAAAATGGASTVLLRSQFGAENVIALSRQAAGAPGWPAVLKNYLARCDPPGSGPQVVVDGEEELARGSGVGAAFPCVLLATAGETTEELARRAAHWLARRPDLVVIVLGPVSPGPCEHLASLVSAFGGASPYRVSLPRDLAPALQECGLVLVYRQDHPHLADMLARLRKVFTGTFSIPGLVKDACEAAIQTARVEEQLRQSMDQLAEARRLLAEKDRALSGAAYKLARRASAVRARLAPAGTARSWVLKKMVRWLQAWQAPRLRRQAVSTEKP